MHECTRAYMCVHIMLYIPSNKYVDEFPFRPNIEGKASGSIAPLRAMPTDAGNDFLNHPISWSR